MYIYISNYIYIHTVYIYIYIYYANILHITKTYIASQFDLPSVPLPQALSSISRHAYRCTGVCLPLVPSPTTRLREGVLAPSGRLGASK